MVDMSSAVGGSLIYGIMAKVNIYSVHRVAPVHPDHQWFMGMMWRQKLYIPMVLSF